MKTAAVFSGIESLDYLPIRESLLRIPQVMKFLRHSQSIFDSVSEKNQDLVLQMLKEDAEFCQDTRMRRLLTMITQVALLARHNSKSIIFDCLVGGVDPKSTLHVVAGNMSFADYIHHVMTSSNEENKDPFSGEILLSRGARLSEYGIFHFQDGDYNFDAENNSSEIEDLIPVLLDKYRIHQFVNIGPSNSLVERNMSALQMSDVQIIDSVSCDPMLQWFWKAIQEQEMKVAN